MCFVTRHYTTHAEGSVPIEAGWDHSIAGPKSRMA
jgi:hypothetical protein